jgi:hypothetical protein
MRLDTQVDTIRRRGGAASSPTAPTLGWKISPSHYLNLNLANIGWTSRAGPHGLAHVSPHLNRLLLSIPDPDRGGALVI